MPRKRIIQPDFWTDRGLSGLTRDARLLFIATWNYADDHAVCKGDAQLLKSIVFPYDLDIDATTVEKWIEELIIGQFVVPYMARGERYLFIVNFYKHQRIDHPSGPQHPQPTAEAWEIIRRLQTDGDDPLELREERRQISTTLVKTPRGLAKSSRGLAPNSIQFNSIESNSIQSNDPPGSTGEYDRVKQQHGITGSFRETEQKVLQHIFKRYREKFGVEYIWTKSKDGPALSHLMRTLGPDQTRELFDEMLKSPDDFYQKAGCTLPVLRATANKLLQKIRAPKAALSEKGSRTAANVAAIVKGGKR